MLGVQKFVHHYSYLEIKDFSSNYLSYSLYILTLTSSVSYFQSFVCESFDVCIFVTIKSPNRIWFSGVFPILCNKFE